MNVANHEELEQEASLELYKTQLSQVDQAIQISGETADLVQLKNDLKELITLTEENLLQLKKSRLLRTLGGSSADITVESNKSEEQDDEYAAFQASISQLSSQDARSEHHHPSSSTPPANPSSRESRSSHRFSGENRSRGGKDGGEDGAGSSSDSDDEDKDDDDGDDDAADESATLTHLIGTKCQAPIKNEWGGHHYGNAMIWSVDTPSALIPHTEFEVRVIFLNPTQPSMVPCSYYMDGNCRFSTESCRRSHGQAVLVSELRPYVEPDHSQISEGCRCLAKSSDEVWYPATVTDVCDDHLVNVKFDAGGRESTVQVEHIKPISDEDLESSDESDDEAKPSENKHKLEKGDDDGEEDEGDIMPVYLWRPSHTTEKLGAWEAHTKGVGSRLMAKMGYITGQGLGPSGEGRAEPVPIMLLPQGKSLDKIMELKEMAGNADLFNAMKKLEKRQKAMEKKEAEKEKRREAKSNWGVFGFLNKELGSDSGHKNGSGHAHHSRHAHSSKHGAAKATPTAARELAKRSDKEVNVQIFKTAEEIRSVERHLGHLRQQLARNESRDRKMAEQVRQKIREQETYLQQLKTSSQTLETHKQNRHAHKKLTVF